MIEDQIRATLATLSETVDVPPTQVIAQRRRRRARMRALAALPVTAAVAVLTTVVVSTQPSGDRSLNNGGAERPSNEISPGVLAAGADLRHRVAGLSGRFVVLSPNALVLGLPPDPACGPQLNLLAAPRAHGQTVTFDVASHLRAACPHAHKVRTAGTATPQTVVLTAPLLQPNIKTVRLVGGGDGASEFARIPRAQVGLGKGLAVVTGRVVDGGEADLPAVVQAFQRRGSQWRFQANAKVADDGTFAVLVPGAPRGLPYQLRAAVDGRPCAPDRITAIGGRSLTLTIRCGAVSTAISDRTRCRGAHFSAALLNDVSPQTGEHAFLVRVVYLGDRPCTLRGYPEITLVAADGRVLPFDYRHHGPYVTETPPQPLHLHSRSPAFYFKVAKYRCDAGPVTTSAIAHLTFPRAQPSVELHIPSAVQFGYCPEPQSRIIYVSPFERTRAGALA
jgi:hypothetical protein